MVAAIKKLNDFLAGMPMTIVAGILLIISFVCPRVGIDLPFDPAWGSVFICGIPLAYLSIWRVIYNKGISKISSALLITIAMIASVIIKDLFAAGEVGFIMSLGALLEEMTTERAKKGLHKLISLTPVQGRLLKDGKETMISAEEIKQGDLLRVLPGEAIPVDGIIVSGETSVDQSIMTGESLPVDKTVGEELYCGTINRFGSVDIKATNVGEDSSLKKLIRMVADAENKQAPMQRIADKWASYLVPIALLIAILAYVVTGDFIRCVTVMVVFCPCALVLATPTAIMAAIGQATKHGVIIKSGEALEKMGHVSTICFDKTGTLTYGKLTVSDVIPVTGMSEESLLAMAAAAESKSEHPLAKAIVQDAKEKQLVVSEVAGFQMKAGRGVKAELVKAAGAIAGDGAVAGAGDSAVAGADAVNGDGQTEIVYCGNEAYLEEQGIQFDQEQSTMLTETMNKLRSEGKASILVADQNKLLGIIALSDTLRPDAKTIIEKLNKLGTETVLLTGDNKQTADFFASKVGMESVKANLLPEEKVSAIEEYQKSGNMICMIGDGVNDAPSLKLAEVGVAMGGMGSDIAVEAADIALMGDDISKLPYLKKLSNETVKTIKIGITLSMCINFCAICASVAGILTPTTGALVHNCGSCLVVAIAALLYDRKFEV